jgi:hypothetical protein
MPSAHSSLLCLALAAVLALAPSLDCLDCSSPYISAWAKDGGGKGGGGNGSGGGNGNGGSGGKSGNANQGKGKAYGKDTSSAQRSARSSVVQDTAWKTLSKRLTKPALLEVFEAREELENATAKFNAGLADPNADLEPLLAAIERAEQKLITAGGKLHSGIGQDITR